MRSTHRAKKSGFTLMLLTLLIAMAVLSAGVSADEAETIMMSQQAQGQTASGQGCVNCNAGISTGSTAGSVSTAGLPSLAYSAVLNGGYTAAGVGMRNRGWGTIILRDVPSGATTSKAFLFWSVIGPSGLTTPPSYYAQGKFNGYAITGTYLGSSAQPCWAGGYIFAYRADVTPYVTGNNVYHLTNFASGDKYGTDPWTANYFPSMEGASLVDVYSKANYPSTYVKIMNGVQTFTGSTPQTTTFTGYPAYGYPVTRTTFIVADAQSNGGTKTLKVDGITVAGSNQLMGNDRQNGVNFVNGNLQDTYSALVKSAKYTGTHTASITLNGADCVTWIAQVMSISNGYLDTDGDALKDSWELYGYDYNNDGVNDVNLQNLGASPYHKDLYIWVDYMANTTSEVQDRHKPTSAVFTTAYNTFANANWASATSTTNVDGTPGVRLHSYLMWKVPHQDNLQISATNWAVVDAIRNPHMNLAYRDIFHYCLFGHGYDGGSSSGISRGIPASDFVVMLGLWGSSDTVNAKTGTYIHEFGHNIGLTHGGNDHNNYKPNYLSIMNYFFQIDGVYRNGAWYNYDFQRTTPYSLNENSLIEADGIGTVSAGYGTKYYCPNGAVKTVTVNKPIDWNCNNVIDASAVAVDINHDGSKTVLGSQLNWQNLVYNGGTIGGISAGGVPTQMVAADKMPEELTYEQYVEMTKAK